MRRLQNIPTLFAILCAPLALAQIPEQYPKPLIHTQADHPAKHILLISVDGMHAFDLANYVAAHPRSTLAYLSARGVTYTNAHAPLGDPAVGLLALVTGGTPISTGIISSDYGSSAPQVNTIFEVVHNKIGPTAWAGDSAASMTLLAGPSTAGIDHFYLNESGAAGDAARIAAVVDWIHHGNSGDQSTLILYGLSLHALAVAQATPGLAYADAVGTPSNGLAKIMNGIDAQLGTLVSALKQSGQYDSTWIVIAAPYGQSRIDQKLRRAIPPAAIAATIKPAQATHISGGDIAMIWLKDHAATEQAVKALEEKAGALGIADILAGERLALTLNRPDKDPRTPDIIIKPIQNVVYTAADAAPLAAAHGGLAEWDTHVAMLISGARLTGRTDPTWVPTTQLAPLLLRALGMEKFDLDALHREHTPALPGIF